MKCCRFGASSVYTIQPYTRLQCHFIQSHIGRVYACLAVTCHLHFWQNDRDLLRATAVTRGWNVYRNKSRRRKVTLEKNILPPLLQGFEPVTFQSRVRHSAHWAIPLPGSAAIIRGAPGMAEGDPAFQPRGLSGPTPDVAIAVKEARESRNRRVTNFSLHPDKTLLSPSAAGRARQVPALFCCFAANRRRRTKTLNERRKD